MIKEIIIIKFQNRISNFLFDFLLGTCMHQETFFQTEGNTFKDFNKALSSIIPWSVLIFKFWIWINAKTHNAKNWKYSLYYY